MPPILSPTLSRTRVAQAVPLWLTLLLALTCGLIGANVYYTQPLVGPISADLGMSPHVAGFIVTMGQLGYCAGLMLVVPLGDLIENRRLVISLIGIGAVGLVTAGLATHSAMFLSAAAFVGLGAVAVQVLIPYTAHLAPEAVRGQVVGNVMSGLMLGIMLSRPVAGFITNAFSWHAVFFTSAVLMVGLAIVLRAVLPARQPEPGVSYLSLLYSMGGLTRRTPLLRRRAAYQVGLFAAYNVFWTTVPLLLAQRFHFSQSGIAVFALAGVAGTFAAPIAGRIADRGWSRPATLGAMLAVAACFALALLNQGDTRWSLGLLVVAANLLDFGVTANLVLGQRAIFTLGAAYRARLNALYMAMFFGIGGLGSALGGWAYAQGGWPMACWIGLALPMAATVYWGMEK